MKKLLLPFIVLLLSISTSAQCNCNLLGDNFFTGDYNVTQTVSGPFGFAFSTDGSATTVNLSATSDNERSFDAIYLPSFSNTVRTFKLNLSNCEATFTPNQNTGFICTAGILYALGPNAGGTYTNIDDTSFTVVYQEDSLGSCGEPTDSVVTLTFTKVSAIPSLVNIPDPNFEQALIDLSLDNTLDGTIDAQVATAINDLNVSSSNIQNLTGIEAFINLDILIASNNNLSSVDLSNNCSLVTLIISDNQLTSLSLKNVTNFIEFGATNNPELECIEVDDVAYMNTNFSTSVDPQTTFNTSCNEDYNALVALYNSTNGANWTNTWDLNAPISTYFGVTLDANNRVAGISLTNNNLVGTLPAELGNLTNLDALSLQNNQLSGSIPSELGNLTNLTNLILFNNQLNGTIPTSIGNLTSLLFLELSDNSLTGSIPTELGNLSNLIFINLNNNQLFGSIPNELGNLSSLETLSIQDNGLSGSIPSELGSLINLTGIGLKGNQLSGNIPSELGNLANLSILSLFDNQLTGNIPSELGNLTNLSSLSLSTNQLSGSIPSQLGNLTSLNSLFLSRNQLTGSIPAELGNLSNSLTNLSLDNNQLSGDIPTELGSLPNLQTLSLWENQLTGSIPTELGDLTILNNLFLARNNLSGNIPTQLGNLQSLSGLTLNNNNLSGNIPSELGNLVNLTFLTLQSNDLEGSIPTEFSNLTNLNTLSLNDNRLSFIPTELNSLSNLSSINISNNNFIFLDIENIFTEYQSIQTFIYAPQNTFGNPENTVTLDEGTSTTLSSLFTSFASENNTYQWYKDDVAIDGATNPTYEITNADANTAGVYILSVNNTGIPDLELESDPVTVNVNLDNPNYLLITDTSILRGESGNIDLQLINSEEVRGIQFDITLPSEFTFDTADLIERSRIADFQTSISDLGNNTFRVISFSLTSAVLAAGDEAVLSFPTLVDDMTTAGEYTLDLTNVIISDVNVQDIATPAEMIGVITVEEFPIGDSNGSGSVDILDLLQTVDFVLGNNPNPFVFSASDINMDMNIDILDVLGIQDIILNGGMSDTLISSSNQDTDDTLAMDNYLLVQDINVLQNSSVNVEIDLVNDDIIRGFQFDIEIPDGFTLDLNSLTATGPLAGFIVSNSDLGNNMFRVLAFSFSGQTLPIDSGSILSLPIAIDTATPLGSYNFPITNVILSDINNIDIASTPLSIGSINVVDTLGIEDNSIDSVVKMFPNPANDVLNLNLNNNYSGTITLNIYDISGKLIYNNPVEKTKTNFNKKIDVSQFTNGLYILNIKTEKSNISKQFIISK